MSISVLNWFCGIAVDIVIPSAPRRKQTLFTLRCFGPEADLRKFSVGKCSRPNRAVFPFLRAVIHFNRRRCAATTLTFPVRGIPSGRGFSLGRGPSSFTKPGIFPELWDNHSRLVWLF